MAERPARVWRELIGDPRHGPLPGILLLMTTATGAIDAYSVLHLGHVFVANMTGNVVIAGIALAGAPGFSVSASLLALGGFVVGAAAGGALGRRLDSDRAVLLVAASAIVAVLVAFALGLSVSQGEHLSGAPRASIAALLAVGMGVQNAAVRRLAVPDVATNVLTTTLTSVAANLSVRSGGPVNVRQWLTLLTMVVGAVVGALLVLHVGANAALAVPAGLLVVVLVASVAASRSRGEWRSHAVGP